jgi:hypothetical protein
VKGTKNNMKLKTDQELIELGRKAQELRSKGGKTVLAKRGRAFFVEIARISAENRRIIREGNSKLPVDKNV